MAQASGVAAKYAQALYESTKNHEVVLNQIRSLERIFAAPEAATFVSSKTITAEQKVSMLKTSISGKGLSPEVENFTLLLAENSRLQLLPEILKQLEVLVDTENGATRGEVRSAIALDQESRSRLEQVISKVTKKRVILSYIDDQKLVGGVLAKVGGWTFEDSLSAHLKRLNEDLKRRAN